MLKAGMKYPFWMSPYTIHRELECLLHYIFLNQFLVQSGVRYLRSIVIFVSEIDNGSGVDYNLKPYSVSTPSDLDGSSRDSL